MKHDESQATRVSHRLKVRRSQLLGDLEWLTRIPGRGKAHFSGFRSQFEGGDWGSAPLPEEERAPRVSLGEPLLHRAASGKRIPNNRSGEWGIKIEWKGCARSRKYAESRRSTRYIESPGHLGWVHSVPRRHPPEDEVPGTFYAVDLITPELLKRGMLYFFPL